MMIHLKLFIPLSMLTTLLISHICYNDNLKFKKIPFGYAVREYALDDPHFPVEESLSNAEFMQVHKHWLMLIKISAEPSIYGSWKAHHNRVVDDPDFLKWSYVWHFQFDSNSISKLSPALQELFLIVSGMQSFKATYWLPK